MPTPPRRPRRLRVEAAAGDLIESYVVRPKRWHCIRCGWRCANPEHNSYLCHQCGELRPLLADSATLRGCDGCGEWNLVVAEYCEWCGAPQAVAGR